MSKFSYQNPSKDKLKINNQIRMLYLHYVRNYLHNFSISVILQCVIIFGKDYFTGNVYLFINSDPNLV